MWKEAVVDKFYVLLRYLSRGSAENQRKLQSGYPVSGLRFQAGTLQ